MTEQTNTANAKITNAKDEINGFNAEMSETVSNSAIVTRMQRACGVRNDAKLALYLSKSSSAVSAWRKAKSPPFRACFEVAKRMNVTMEWLLTGRKPMKDEQGALELESGQFSAEKPVSQDVFISTFIDFIDVACKVKMLSKPADLQPKELRRLALGLYTELYGSEN